MSRILKHLPSFAGYFIADIMHFYKKVKYILVERFLYITLFPYSIVLRQNDMIVRYISGFKHKLLYYECVSVLFPSSPTFFRFVVFLHIFDMSSFPKIIKIVKKRFSIRVYETLLDNIVKIK